MTSNLATMKRSDQLAALRSERTNLQGHLRRAEKAIDVAEEWHECIVAQLNYNLAAIAALENQTDEG